MDFKSTVKKKCCARYFLIDEQRFVWNDVQIFFIKLGKSDFKLVEYERADIEIKVCIMACLFNFFFSTFKIRDSKILRFQLLHVFVCETAEFAHTFHLTSRMKSKNFLVQLSHAQAREFQCDCLYTMEASEVPVKYIQFIVVIRLTVSVSKQVNSQ